MKFEKPKSSIERVVGSTPEFEEKILKEKAELFDDQIFEHLKGVEREITEEEKKMIGIANYATNAMRLKYGIDEFDIPAKNFHMIPEEEWAKEPAAQSSAGYYNAKMQGVVIRDKNRSKVKKLSAIIHEMLHFKSYNALQGLNNKEDKTQPKELYTYRIGLMGFSRDGKQKYFSELNEAITEELSKRTMRNLIGDLRENPIFSDELSETEGIIKEYSGTAIDGRGKSLFTGDTLYAEIITQETIPDQGGDATPNSYPSILTKEFVYKKQRRMLNSIIDRVWNKHKDIYKDQEEVFDVFAKAYMTGNLLTIGRLIEDTFGEGTLRKIGELNMRPEKKKPTKPV